MKYLKIFMALFAIILYANFGNIAEANENTNANIKDDMIVRISEIEVYPQYLPEYIEAVKKVGDISVKEETGVIAIFPMQQQRNATQFRILEIYKDKKAYQNHIKTEHFQEYKQGTLHMVKSLDLVDMNALNKDKMMEIFIKQ